MPKGSIIYAAITDRKDFDHQSWVGKERALSNVTPFASMRRSSEAFLPLMLLWMRSGLRIGWLEETALDTDLGASCTTRRDGSHASGLCCKVTI